MESELIQQAKEKLVAEKGKIRKQLEEMTGEQAFNKDKVQAKWNEVGDKEEDNALEVANYQDSISLERNLEITLEKIEKALKRIEEGTYGTCDQCGNQIEDDRLLAYPEAGRCLSCHARP